MFRKFLEVSGSSLSPSDLQIQKYDRIPSTKLRLHGKTWDHIKTYLPDDFIHCPEVVRDAIMMDIDNLLQEFWKTADIGAVDVRRFTLIRLLLDILRVCLNITYFYFTTIIDFAHNNP